MYDRRNFLMQIAKIIKASEIPFITKTEWLIS